MGLIRKTSLFQRFLGAELGTRSPHILVQLTTTLGGREGRIIPGNRGSRVTCAGHAAHNVVESGTGFWCF